MGCTETGQPACESPAGPCDQVPAAAMSRLLGGAVRAEPNDRPGERSCRYLPANGVAPYAELTISRGDARARRLAGPAGARTPVGRQPQATPAGPVVVARGDTLITIDLPGQPAAQALAGRIVTVLDAACRPAAVGAVAAQAAS
jgi:hypothetical protein